MGPLCTAAAVVSMMNVVLTLSHPWSNSWPRGDDEPCRGKRENPECKEGHGHIV